MVIKASTQKRFKWSKWLLGLLGLPSLLFKSLSVVAPGRSPGSPPELMNSISDRMPSTSASVGFIVVVAFTLFLTVAGLPELEEGALREDLVLRLRSPEKWV